MGIVHEGEAISDEVLQVYLNLFSKPLSQDHIAAMMSLFGWVSAERPLAEELVAAKA